EHAYAGAMEAIGDIDVPRRAEFIRVIVDEMSRCASHLVWLGTYGLDLGATTPVLWCFRDREEILDMLEELCGSRMNFNYYRVRLGEMRLAIALIRECLDKLPGGTVRARLGHVWKCPKGEAYYTVEGAKGEVGIYMISDGRSPNPFRAKMRGPSFVNLQILPWLLKGRLVADAIAILGSIDIVLGDVDR